MSKGKVLVRNPGTGAILACCWDDCWVPGDDRVKAVVTDGELSERDGAPALLVGTPKKLTYVFCTERHKEYWVNSQRDNGNLPAGARGKHR